ncbi:hypothetical protein [Microlunatus antarcticus]|uniref:Uncharacterized protein n=1 Tax=Microlunatus antarcticus TaxID=53388 RepID=A0A7W5JY41_9ACTN|nr:hypothetical protein [Microlunatus antarcticus]MBB3328494.1 hypothetical protein [Microlunatus antarcticus]
MAGASTDTQRVVYVNANWTVGRHDGVAFELLVVTEDEARHTLQVPAVQMAPLLALTQAPGVVLLWDPAGPTLIAANLLGEWVDPAWSARGRGEPTDQELR